MRDMMNRRGFLTTALTAAGGLLVPEWILDPPKGRSMIAVPGMPEWLTDIRTQDTYIQINFSAIQGMERELSRHYRDTATFVMNQQTYSDYVRWENALK